MKERRRDARIPVRLDVELRRGKWERHLTEDVSRRGMFIRSAGPCPTGQLMKLRVKLPREPEPIEMMARVARRVCPWSALTLGRMPGIGLEFFCMSDHVLRQWERFLQEAAHWLEVMPGCSGYALTRLLERERVAPGIRKPSRSLQEAGADGRSNLIFRAGTLDRLERFLNEELRSGRFGLRIPYRMEENAPVNLRIIHPKTDEEYLLPGAIRHGASRDEYLIDFEQEASILLDSFRNFVLTGQTLAATACPA